MRDPGDIRVYATPEQLEYLDAASVRQLVCRCLQGAMRGSIILPQSCSVDDLVQEVLIVLWRRQLKSGRAFSRTYVARTARSVLVDCLRHAAAKKRGRRQTIELSDACDVCETAASAEDRMLADERLAGLLDRVRSAVPRRAFEAVRLHCVDGLSAGEMAPLLRLSASGVHTVLHRARRAVRSERPPRRAARKGRP